MSTTTSIRVIGPVTSTTTYTNNDFSLVAGISTTLVSGTGLVTINDVDENVYVAAYSGATNDTQMEFFDFPVRIQNGPIDIEIAFGTVEVFLYVV